MSKMLGSSSLSVNSSSSPTWFAELEQDLAQRREQSVFRQFATIQHKGPWVYTDTDRMLNLSGNDYLGLAADADLRQAFWQSDLAQEQLLGSASSRLLTGNFPIYEALEQLLAERFQTQAALLFNSGYHANIGILPALTNQETLLLMDTLVHASLIDGSRLSKAQVLRYRHNDYQHLEQLLAQHHEQFERLIIVTESVFSMDGDCADLTRLVALKKRYPKAALYVDEAHAIGVYGPSGLGVAEQAGCIADIDILVGTFGKALGSVGAYMVGSQLLRDALINTMRPLIFATALPPINIAWTYFLFKQLPLYDDKRQYLARISQHLRQAIERITGQTNSSQTCIVPLVVGENHRAVQLAQKLREAGFYCLPIRPPTVPRGTARVRFSLSADMPIEEIEALIQVLEDTCKV